MFPIYSLDEFLAMSEDDFSTEELLNLYDETDQLHERVKKAPLSENYLWVACHANSDTFGVIIYAGDVSIARNSISSERMVDTILDSGLWDGQDIIFLSCKAGVPGGPAEAVANLLDANIVVYAPVTTVFFKISGFFYVSDYSLPAGHPDLEPSIQSTRWNEY